MTQVGARGAATALWLAIAAATVASTYLLIWPVYSDGRTLIDANGPRVLLSLLAPVAVTSAPLLTSKPVRSRACAGAGVALAALCVLGAFSIGAAYVPASLLLLVGAAYPTMRARFAKRASARGWRS